jgi:hypothetical protein
VGDGAVSTLPPLPPGFKLDSAQGVPPLPEGFTLDQPAQPQQPDAFAGDDLLSNESMQRLSAGERSTVTPSRDPSFAERAGRYIRDYARGVDQADANLQRATAGGGRALGAAETGATLLSGAVAPALGAIESAVVGTPQEEAINRYTYQPRSEAGRATLQYVGALAKPAVDAGAATGADVALAPLAAESQAMQILPRAPRVAAPRQRTAEDVLSAMRPADSVGASAASLDIQAATPDLRNAIVSTAQKRGGINREVAMRHSEADSLPVPVPLTEGDATQNPVIISKEMNMRGRFPEIAERKNQQNRALAENVRTLREQVGPDVFSTNAVEHGDSLIAAYKEIDAAAEANIKARYDALRQAAGGQFPVGARTLLENASQQLHKKLLFDHAPRTVMSTLERLASQPGTMTFENFEALRTNLARIQRTSQDGNEVAAAGIIRQAMEDLPLVPGAAKLKPLADAARKAARERFAALEADPAYAAAVNDKVPPDKFVQRFIISAPRDQVGKMAQALSGNETAKQTIGVAVLDHLRDQARLSPFYEGNFAAASYNKALRQLDPKLRHVLPQPVAESVEKLGRVANYVTAQPRGSFVNNSNNFVAQAADYGAGAIEGAANVAAGGVPIGTWGRRAFGAMRERRELRNALSPYAGLDVPETNAFSGGGR